MLNYRRKLVFSVIRFWNFISILTHMKISYLWIPESQSCFKQQKKNYHHHKLWKVEKSFLNLMSLRKKNWCESLQPRWISEYWADHNMYSFTNSRFFISQNKRSSHCLEMNYYVNFLRHSMDNGFIFKKINRNKDYNIKERKRSWGPFRIYQLASTANQAQFHSNRAIGCAD